MSYFCRKRDIFQGIMCTLYWRKGPSPVSGRLLHPRRGDPWYLYLNIKTACDSLPVSIFSIYLSVLLTFSSKFTQKAKNGKMSQISAVRALQLFLFRSHAFPCMVPRNPAISLSVPCKRALLLKYSNSFVFHHFQR